MNKNNTPPAVSPLRSINCRRMKTKPPFRFFAIQVVRDLSQDSERKVPCGSCSACCKTMPYITMADIRIESTLIGHSEWSDKKNLRRMVPRTDGYCPYYKDGCSIHATRPMQCRVYDCRIDAAFNPFIDENNSLLVAGKYRLAEDVEPPSANEKSLIKFAAAVMKQINGTSAALGRATCVEFVKRIAAAGDGSAKAAMRLLMHATTKRKSNAR